MDVDGGKRIQLVGGRRMNVSLNAELFEEVEYFKYPGSKITLDVGIETVKSRIIDVGIVLGGKKVFSCRAMGMNVKRRLYEGVVAPTTLYRAEHGVWQ